MPYTPEALAKRAKIAAAYDWFRQRLVLIIVSIMLILQFMTWRTMAEFYVPRPPTCSRDSPCYVQGTISLDEYTIRQLRSRQ
jgi:hypothetical protein